MDSFHLRDGELFVSIGAGDSLQFLRITALLGGFEEPLKNLGRKTNPAFWRSIRESHSIIHLIKALCVINVLSGVSAISMFFSNPQIALVGFCASAERIATAIGPFTYLLTKDTAALFSLSQLFSSVLRHLLLTLPLTNWMPQMFSPKTKKLTCYSFYVCSLSYFR